MKLDNIAPISDPAAKAALRFMAGLEAGFAGVAPTPDGGGRAIVNGSKVVYRSLAGDIYDAVVTKFIHEERGKFVDIDVIVPGCAKPVRLTKIKFQQEGS